MELNKISGKNKTAPSVVLIGLDGATFNQLIPLTAEGKLKSLAKIVKEGASGILKSTIPPTTPPAWTTMLTGVNPGRHGIFDFRLTTHQNPQRPLISMGSMKSIKIWEALEKMGFTSGFLNIPVMYPPEKINGWIISGMMAPSKESQFTWPPELKENLLGAFPDYVIDVDIPRYDNTFWEDIEIFLDDLLFCTKKRVEAFFYLWEHNPVDFLMAVFIATDRIGHLLWKFLDPSYPHYKTEVAIKVRKKVDEIYTVIDDMLAETIRKISAEGGMLVVMSDHGFGATEGFFNANRFLEELGLLKIRKEFAAKKRLFFRAWKIGDSNIIRKGIPKFLQRKLRSKIRRGRSSFINDVEPFIDFDKTKAFYASVPCHGFFIGNSTASSETKKNEYNDIKEKIKMALSELKTPEGTKMVTDLWDREEIYNGPMVRFAPDIIFSCGNYSIVPRPVLGATEIYTPSKWQSNGFHRMDGIVIFWGEGIGTKNIENASMVDIAPTILKKFEVPLPPAMEGKALV